MAKPNLRQDIKKRKWHISYMEEGKQRQTTHSFEFRESALARGIEVAFTMKPESMSRPDCFRRSRVLVQDVQQLESYNLYRLPGNQVMVKRSEVTID